MLASFCWANMCGLAKKLAERDREKLSGTRMCHNYKIISVILHIMKSKDAE